MRPEYDFTGLPGVRGKHAAAYRQGYTRTVYHADGTREITIARPLEGSIVLDPDVQAYFPDIACLEKRDMTRRLGRLSAPDHTTLRQFWHTVYAVPPPPT